MPDFDTTKELTTLLEKSSGAPLLFVGSGVPRRYLDIPTWDSLLERFATKYLPDKYGFYKSAADNDLAKTASLMADAFHPIWWKDGAFAEQREAYSGKEPRKQDPFKIALAASVSPKPYTIGSNRVLDEEIQHFKSVRVASIVTTNWDSLLEELFPTYERRVGSNEILSSSFDSLAEIYKIHGSADDPLSLVVTKEDYASFKRRWPYITAKLLTFFVEYPVVFLGYSLSDSNVQEVLEDVFSALDISQVKMLQDRLILIQRESDKGKWGSTVSYVQANDHKVPITVLNTDDFAGVYRAMAEARIKFPTRVLRLLKEQVYELVKESEPTGRLAVVGLDNDVDLEKVDVVIGVGLSSAIGRKGYQVIRTRDLLADVIRDDGKFDPKAVVEQVLPREKTGNRRYVPVFKYLRGGGFKPFGTHDVPSKLRVPGDRKSFDPPEQIQRSYSAKAKALKTFAKIASEPPEEAIFEFLTTPSDGQDVKVLQAFLAKHWEPLMASAKPNVKTYTGALVCLYDWLAFGPTAPSGAGDPKPVAVVRDGGEVKPHR
ncbi:hypothetical protein ANRL1_04714 [Anaerolineae bacterium]|nr:hypothetical protein ANRL1_04714 [Anaerolineae bacterium]